MTDFRLDVGVAELSELWYTSFIVPYFKQSGLSNNVIFDHYAGIPVRYCLRGGPSHLALSIS